MIEPGAEEKNQTAMIVLEKGAASEVARYYESTSALTPDEFLTANGSELDRHIDAIYEQYEKLWLHDNVAGEIVVLSLTDRTELGRITGLPRGDSATPGARLNGMAFSNLSQAWVTVYGGASLIHVDARNLVAVRTVDLPGEPTAIATVDNRVFIGLEMADGSGAIGLMRSNDPDLEVETIATLRRPPIYMSINPDREHIAMITPGEESDLPETSVVDTDPALRILDLVTYDLPFDGRFIAPNLRDYVGRHPVFASNTKNFFIYLATSESVKRIDTKAWGNSIDFLPRRSYSAVSADYFADLVYAVPTDERTTVERITKFEERLSSLTLPGPVTALTFVSSSKVNQP